MVKWLTPHAASSSQAIRLQRILTRPLIDEVSGVSDIYSTPCMTIGCKRQSTNADMCSVGLLTSENSAWSGTSLWDYAC